MIRRRPVDFGGRVKIKNKEKDAVLTAYFKHSVVALTFAEQEVFTKKQIGRGQIAGDVIAAFVVHVNATGRDVFAGLALGRTEAGLHDEVDQVGAFATQLVGLEIERGDFTDHVGEHGFTDPIESATEHDCAGFFGVLTRIGAVDEGSHGGGEGFLGGAGSGSGGDFGFERFDLFF